MNKTLLKTKRTILRPMTVQDAEDIVKWRNDDDVLMNLFSKKKITLIDHLNWFSKYQEDETRMEWIIQLKSSHDKLGTIGLSSIDYVKKTAEYGILIGEKAYWGKGFAKEASLAVLEYGHEVLQLEFIYLNVYRENANALNLYKKLGFVQEFTNENVVHMRHSKRS